MFAGPGGVQAVKRDDFLKVVPKRAAFFRAIGLVASEVRRLEEIRLDEKHTMVRAYWSLRFEQDAGRPLIDEIEATYIPRREESWQIVFQLDHQDLTRRVQELGSRTVSTPAVCCACAPGVTRLRPWKPYCVTAPLRPSWPRRGA